MPTIAIIGAGCSGLAAAHELRDAGYRVTLFEQEPEVGGRASTRSKQGFLYDDGAQYIKGDDPFSTSASWITGRFRLPDLIDIGKPVWAFDRHGQIVEGDPLQNAGHKWTYRSGLNALPRRMAQGLDVRLATAIGHLEQQGAGWQLFDVSRRSLGLFEQVLVAVPAPRAAALVEASQLPAALQENVCVLLGQASYRPLLSIMLGVRPAPHVRPYYALVNTDKAHAISWLAWEHEKARERVPRGAGLLIAQMAPHYSREHWHSPANEIIADVAEQVAVLLNETLSPLVFTDIRYWPYALPASRADAKQLNALSLPLGLAFCGDGFVGGRIHLALEHGVAVAQQLLRAC